MSCCWSASVVKNEMTFPPLPSLPHLIRRPSSLTSPLLTNSSSVVLIAFTSLTLPPPYLILSPAPPYLVLSPAPPYLVLSPAPSCFVLLALQCSFILPSLPSFALLSLLILSVLLCPIIFSYSLFRTTFHPISFLSLRTGSPFDL